MENENKYILCYPTEEGTYKPLTLKDGELYLLPLGVAKGKVEDGGAGSHTLIILDTSELPDIINQALKSKAEKK